MIRDIHQYREFVYTTTRSGSQGGAHREPGTGLGGRASGGQVEHTVGHLGGEGGHVEGLVVVRLLVHSVHRLGVRGLPVEVALEAGLVPDVVGLATLGHLALVRSVLGPVGSEDSAAVSLVAAVAAVVLLGVVQVPLPLRHVLRAGSVSQLESTAAVSVVLPVGSVHTVLLQVPVVVEGSGGGRGADERVGHLLSELLGELVGPHGAVDGQGQGEEGESNQEFHDTIYYQGVLDEYICDSNYIILDLEIFKLIHIFIKQFNQEMNPQQQMQAPVMILNTNADREVGNKAQMGNIAACKAIADIIISTLGPRSMLKMLMDPMGGIVLSNDGHAILREIDVKHPAAKSMLEISRSQDEEVGDGTTSVIVMAGEMMQSAKPFIDKKIHPSIIVQGYYKAMQEAVKIIQQVAKKVDVEKDDDIKDALRCCIGTKFSARWSDLVVDLSLQSVRCIMRGANSNKLTVDLKRYAKVEKIPGGLLEECCVLDGVMLNKDVTHPQMRRHIKNPRVMLLDCSLEYKKGESATNMEMTEANHMVDALQQEVNEVAQMCNYIMKWNPDVVVTEKGVSDLAQHFLMKQNISVIRRARKTDNNRIARVTGATIGNRPEELQESDIGNMCGLYEVRKIGDDYFSFFVECKDPKACTIMLRGGSKDTLNELERNLQDALAVAKNVANHPMLLPGGGAIEMEVAHRLREYSKTQDSMHQLPIRAVAYAMEVIPRTLAQNCGADVVRVMTDLRAKHASGDNLYIGIDGNKGKIADMRDINVWEPLAVKEQVYKSSIEASCMLLRIDDVVSGIKKKREEKKQIANSNQQSVPDEQNTFGDARDG